MFEKAQVHDGSLEMGGFVNEFWIKVMPWFFGALCVFLELCGIWLEKVYFLERWKYVGINI